MARPEEIEHHQAAAGAEHAPHLVEAGVGVVEVAQPEAADDAGEGAVGEGQLERVGAHHRHRGLVAAAHQHRLREVAGDDASAGAGEQRRQVERARAHVEDAAALQGAERSHGTAAPRLIDAQR
jgi:hypothetical protein